MLHLKNIDKETSVPQNHQGIEEIRRRTFIQKSSRTNYRQKPIKKESPEINDFEIEQEITESLNDKLCNDETFIESSVDFTQPNRSKPKYFETTT